MTTPNPNPQTEANKKNKKQSQNQTQNLVTVQQKVATLDQLISNYNQLYQTYLQEVESEVDKNQQRKYPYNLKNPNEFGNPITPATPFPSDGTEDTCFKSCIDNSNCAYALYSNSGCGIDCNPNKCLLYGKNADGVAPVAEVPSTLPGCPASGDKTAWCKAFNNPVINAIIPVFVIRKGGTNWRTLAGQMPTGTANASDTQWSVDLTTNIQSWWPDTQFTDVNYAPANEISMQFRYFAEYWLNAYNLQTGNTLVIAGQGTIGTFTFSKLNISSNATAIPNTTQNMVGYRGKSGIFSINITGAASTGGSVWGTDIYTDDSDIRKAAVHAGVIQNGENKTVYIEVLPGNPSYSGSFRNSVSTFPYGNWQGSYKFASVDSSYVGTFGGQIMIWNSNQPPSGGAAAGLQTAEILASNTASSKFNYNYSAFEKPIWKVTPNTNAMMGQLPPQVAQMSVPSWQFLGLQDTAEACQSAAMNDPSHVYTTATYFNASYNNSANGNNAFARTCYAHVAGAPSSTVTTATNNDNNVQTMTPHYGYTKLGGKDGITILKKMYHLNKQIMALTDDLKIAIPQNAQHATTKEAFTQKPDQTQPTNNVSDISSIESLAQKIKMDEIKLNKTISKYDYLDADEIESKRLLLYSRIKLGVGIVLGLFMGYLAYRFLTADDELPNAIKEEITLIPGAAAVAAVATPMRMNADMDPDMDADMDMDSLSKSFAFNPNK